MGGIDTGQAEGVQNKPITERDKRIADLMARWPSLVDPLKDTNPGFYSILDREHPSHNPVFWAALRTSQKPLDRIPIDGVLDREAAERAKEQTILEAQQRRQQIVQRATTTGRLKSLKFGTGELRNAKEEAEKPRLVQTSDKIPYLTDVRYRQNPDNMGKLPVLYPEKDNIEAGSIIGYIAPDPQQPGTMHRLFGMVRDVEAQRIVVEDATTTVMGHMTIQDNPDGSHTAWLSYDPETPRTLRWLGEGDFVPADELRAKGIHLPKVE